MRVIPLTEIPLVSAGDEVGDLLIESLRKQGVDLEGRDLIVVAQTVVSKAEGNTVDLSRVDPGPRAREIADRIGKDPRKVEVILRQSDKIIKSEHALITQTRHGFVCANAGVDASNVEPGFVTTLPEDPDASAGRIRDEIRKRIGKEVAVIISDSWGRPFRLGALGFAIGVAGMKSLKDMRGEEDAYGETLESTRVALPDALAAAASVVMGEADELVPAVVIKGVSYEPAEGGIGPLLRPEEEDLFR